MSTPNSIAAKAAETWRPSAPAAEKAALAQHFQAAIEEAYAKGWNESWQNQDLLRENDRKESESRAATAERGDSATARQRCPICGGWFNTTLPPK